VVKQGRAGAMVRAKQKKGIFLQGEVFFLMTSPLTGCCPNPFFTIVFPEVTNFIPILNIINKITIYNNNIK